MQSIIKKELNEHLTTLDATMKSIGSSLEVAANICIDSLKQGGKVLIFGNGGSDDLPANDNYRKRSLANSMLSVPGSRT